MAACVVGADNRHVEIDSDEDAMNWTRNRPSGSGDQWISARQVFVGSCWAALFAAFVLDQTLRPLFH